MKTATIENLIDESDISQLQKNVIKGFIQRSKEREEAASKDIKLIERVAYSHLLNPAKVFIETIISTEEVKIYKVSGKDDWDKKYPFRSIYLNKKGEWERCSTVSPSLDIAYLIYLQNKHLGANNQFSDFAIKMLEIKIEEDGN